jgi:hypothetical protein
MARTARVNIMVDDSIKERIEIYASRMGLTSSALGAFILGQWVAQQEHITGSLLDVGKLIIEKAAKGELDEKQRN